MVPTSNVPVTSPAIAQSAQIAPLVFGGPCSLADVTTQGSGAADPGYGVPDGLVTASDINYFVNAWSAGCP